MTPDKDNIQALLFDRIARALPDSVSLTDEICATLNLSTDSVYRRLKCETLLTIHETNQLCMHYGISFDSLAGQQDDSVLFRYRTLRKPEDFIYFVKSIKKDLEIICQATNGRVIYAAEDIPIFYNFCLPNLAKFKVFYLQKSIMNVEIFQDMRFNPDLISDDVLEAGRQLYDMYSKVPSIEILTEMTPISLFKQIEFFWESDLFESKEIALALCDDVARLFEMIKKAATLGRKLDRSGQPTGLENSFQLYCSDIEIGNNCIYTEINGCKTAYLAFNTFNKLTTGKQDFCDDIEYWLNNLIGKSTLISGSSEKRRSQFFKMITDRLEATRKKING
jgi:hypothetical protein